MRTSNRTNTNIPEILLKTRGPNILSFAFAILFVLISGNTFSNSKIVLTNPTATYTSWSELSYLWEKDRKYTIEEIITEEAQAEFVNTNSETNNFGVAKTGIWFKVSIKNHVPEKQVEWVMEAAYPHYDTIEFYYQRELGKWENSTAGDHFVFNTRKVYNKNFAYPVSLPDTLTRTFYFHIKTEGPIQLPLIIKSRENYYETQEIIGIIYGGCFFGVIFIMLLYNLFIYFSLKDKLYLLYVLSTFSVLIFYLAITGYGFQYFWGYYPQLNLVLIPFGVFLTGFVSNIFFRTFLDTKKYAPILDKVIVGMIVIFFLELISLLFLDYSTLIRIAAASTAIGSALVMFTSYYVWMKGNRSARFMAFAFTFYFIGIFIYSLSVDGFLNRSFIVTHCMELGTTIELTLLSFALSDKYRILREEKEKAQAELIEVHMRTNEELERKVQERTEQINQQNEKLQGMNHVKDKLLSIISHDLKGPLNAFQSLLSMMMADELTPEKMDEYFRHLNNKLNGMVSLVDNILSWVKSQMEGIKVNIRKVYINNIIKENINVLSSQAELKEITITSDIPEDLCILGDKNVIRLVVRNLLSNAIKFTGNGGNVFIRSETNGDQVFIEVCDTGIGIAKDKLEQLFTDQHFSTPDTNLREGTGLGLLLCKEFLSKTSGNIRVESEEGKGTSFKFSQPLYTGE